MNTKPHLIIENLGPIKNCEIDLTKMIVLDGPQAAGKSTIAKAIFFFRTVKNLVLKNFFAGVSPIPALNTKDFLLKVFCQMFGDSYTWQNDMFLTFDYGSNVRIEISNWKSNYTNREEKFKNHPIQFSDKIMEWFFKYNEKNVALNEKNFLLKELEDLFQDDKEIVYIPAGRSMLSILSESLSHIFFNFDDEQKNMIDYCTTDYINRVTKIKPVFKSPEKIIFADNDSKFNPEFLSLIREKMWKILQGQYKYLNGEEFLQLFDKDSKKIKIKFASSGQQEVLWILNLIYYYILKQKTTCFIIEEPEAHLYPNSQKEIAEYIALALSEKNNCVLTTHSPYILGTLSNLLDARRMMDEGYNMSRLLERENLISTQLLKQSDFSAYFVSDGTMNNAVDDENGLIKNELIDGASDKINGFADDLMYLEREGKINVD